MAFDQDLLVSGSWDKTLRVWNIKSGLCRKVLNLHTEGMCIHTYAKSSVFKLHVHNYTTMLVTF